MNDSCKKASRANWSQITALVAAVPLVCMAVASASIICPAGTCGSGNPQYNSGEDIQSGSYTHSTGAGYTSGSCPSGTAELLYSWPGWYPRWIRTSWGEVNSDCIHTDEIDYYWDYSDEIPVSYTSHGSYGERGVYVILDDYTDLMKQREHPTSD